MEAAQMATEALQRVRRSRRDSRPLRLVTSAPVVLLLDLGGLYAYYLTPVFGWTHLHPAAHLLVHVHMVAAGYLLSGYLIGGDPLPHRGTARVRLLVLLVAFAAHDVLAKLMYAHALPAVATAEEARSAAVLLYYGGDAVELGVAVALLAQWYAASGRDLARQRRREQAAAPAPAVRAEP